MLCLTARAKINWSLDILGRRDDGYHEMDMLMGSVELADTLTIVPSDALALHVNGDTTLQTQDNLVLKSARLLADTCGCSKGASLTLTKAVPFGAGMGGGSADAAAALIGLNALWGLSLSQEELMKLGLRLGADVPFTLIGGLARVGGIGERIAPLAPLDSVPLVIVQPCQALSTGEVFHAFDACTSVRHPDTDQAQSALLQRDLLGFAQATGNVLQQVSEQKRPQIIEAVAALDALGASVSMMTGSGSAIFGAFDSDNAADDAYRTLKKRWRRAWRTRTSAWGVTMEEI